MFCAILRMLLVIAGRHVPAWTVALLLVLSATVANAESGSPVSYSNYRIGTGDRIAVSVFGQTELSGEFVVDGAGNIAVPMAGNLPVRDMTLEQTKDLLTAKLQEGLLVRPSVTVRLAEPRPIHVVGDVRTPGVYPYLYGGIVKSAIAQAGGLLVSAENAGAAVADFLLADERVRVLASSRLSLSIRQARLLAQYGGQKKFDVPPSTSAEDFSKEEASRLVDEEVKALEAESRSHEQQVQVIESQRPQFEQELRALQGQVESERKQMTLVQQQLENYAALVKQGLGRANAQIEIQLAEAARQTNLWRLEGDQSRIRNQIVDLDIRLQDLRATYQRQILTELQDARSRLREAEISLASAREIRAARLQQAGAYGTVTANYSISISRFRNGEVQTIAGTETTFLEPGDIIEIKRILPEKLGMSAAVR